VSCPPSKSDSKLNPTGSPSVAGGNGQSDCIAMVGISFVMLADFQNACKDKANKLPNGQVSVSDINV